MKRNRPNKWRIALGAGILATLGVLPQARAELVYEPEISPNAPSAVRAADREQTRTALESAEKARDTVQAAQVQQVSAPVTAVPVTAVPVTAPMAQTAPVAQMVPTMVAPAQPVALPVAVQVQPQFQVVSPTQEQQPEVQSLSKTELMRRERTRTELKNEDLLEERLEELRLRDEKHRTQQLLGDQNAQTGDQVTPIPGLATGAAAATPTTAALPQSQVVVSPVTDRPGQPAPEVEAPVPSAAQAQQYSNAKSAYTVAAQDQINSSQAVATSVTSYEPSKSYYSIAPRAGVSSMKTDGPFNVSGHFAVGVAGDVNISDNLAFEVGYTYSEYGVNYGQNQMYGVSYDTYTLKQNVIDAEMKLFFLGPDAKVRPFITGGFGYAMGSLNYSQALLSYYQGYYNTQNISPDFKTNSYLGTLGAGLDMRVNRSISIGAQFKYYTVLSANQSNDLYYGGGPGYASSGLANSAYYSNASGTGPAGAALSQSGFFTMTAGVSFCF